MSRALVPGWLLGCAVLLAQTALAHDGPPYPILVDEALAGWTLSVWADPDVGTGTFYYYVEAPPAGTADQVHVQVISAPEDGASPEVEAVSEPADPGEPFQHVGTLPFDHRGTWHTRFVLWGADGSVLGELVYDVEVTPPGLGAFDILWFAFPFLVVAGLWLRGLLAQRAYDRAQRASTGIEP